MSQRTTVGGSPSPDHASHEARANISPSELARRAPPADDHGQNDDAATAVALNQPSPSRGPQKYSHGFFDDAVKGPRGMYLKIVIIYTILTIIAIWAFLTFYWGSLWVQKDNVYRLRTFVVDFDNNSIVSQAVNQAVTASIAGPPPHLGWEVVSGSQYNTPQDLADLVVEQKLWAAVTINPGAAEALLRARQNGDASYDPLSAVTAYYSQARNELAASSWIVPGFTVVSSALAKLSSQNAGSYLSAYGGNATAMALLAQAPQTIGGSFALHLVNLRPYTATVATAVTLVGLIYLLVLSFVQTMAHHAARSILGPYLRNKDYLIIRVLVPMINYGVICLLFCMINLPFKVPFDGGKFSYAGGFFLWWAFLWMGMAALGLATEWAIEILTPKFVSFFLVALIVVNVSETSVPIELSGSYIYRIGYGLPFWNLSQAVRCIIFDTKDMLGRNAGVLLGWIGLSLITVPLTTYLMRRKEMREYEQEKVKTSADDEEEKGV